MQSQPTEGESVQAERVRFIHFRDVNKQLRASVAYYQIQNAIYYGVTVVSPSEPLGDVSFKEARGKASARAYNSLHSPKVVGDVPWKMYRDAPRLQIDTHGYGSPFRRIREYGFQKLGRMSEHKFREIVQKLKKEIGDMY